MCRMYGSDSEMLLLRGNHKMASFTLVEDCIRALIRIKYPACRIAMQLRQRWCRCQPTVSRKPLRASVRSHTLRLRTVPDRRLPSAAPPGLHGGDDAIQM